MKYKALFFMLIATLPLYSQGNCNLYAEGSGEHEACLLCHKAVEFPQGSRESQILFDEAIAVGPTYAWSYYQKSIPYLKRGFLAKGLSILNKAVELEPLEYLCYRAYWYWQYKNYELCINDLETYYSMPKAYVQYTPGGEKNMKNILALCYAKTNQLDKSINILEEQINEYKEDSDTDATDYHSLGVAYYKKGRYAEAIEVFQKQLSIMELSDTYYFLGLTYSKTQRHTEALPTLNRALESLDKANRYVNYNAGFPVYRADVEKLINDIEGIQK